MGVIQKVTVLNYSKQVETDSFTVHECVLDRFSKTESVFCSRIEIDVANFCFLYKVYFNLSSGLEFLRYCNKPFLLLRTGGFTRIQSSHCERNRLDLVLRDIDFSFLINFVSGVRVVVVDGWSRNCPPQSFYKGFEFVRYCLCKVSEQDFFPAFSRTERCLKNFEDWYRKIERENQSLFGKLRYAKKVFESLSSNIIEWNLTYIMFKSELDGKYDKLFELLIRK